jgi:hypothetical protein
MYAISPLSLGFLPRLRQGTGSIALVKPRRNTYFEGKLLLREPPVCDVHHNLECSRTQQVSGGC